jgi:uncharacterized membrane protein YeiB
VDEHRRGKVGRSTDPAVAPGRHGGAVTAPRPVPQPSPTSAGRPHSHRPRIAALDVVRGFALCGILLVNVAPITAASGARELPADPDWISLFAQQRFYVIFSLLFGVGFALLFEAAAARAVRPRVVLLRRLVVLLGIGLLHRLLWGGDILTVYAVIGLVVLLPSTWLPRWAVAGLAAVVTVASAVLLAGGGVTLVPGLFLAGAALVRYGVVDRIERATRSPVLAAVVFVALAVPALLWQVQEAAVTGQLTSTLSSGVAGLLLAGAYVSLLLVGLRTPLRPALVAVFAPLGRMALTNYLGATVAVLLAVAVVGHPERWSTKAVLVLVGVVLVVQWVLCTGWLSRFRQGPVEWLWRWATWARRPAFRRERQGVPRG